MKFIFIVSSPRTGTTYLLKLIEESEAIRLTKKMLDLPEGVTTLETGLFEYRQFAQAVARLQALPQGTYVEKTPGHIRYIRKLITYLPTATYIYIVRNPGEAVLSYCKADFIHFFKKNPFDEGIRLWRDGANEVKNLSIGFVNYDDLINHPVETTKAIYKYCGISGDAEAAVEKHKEGKHIPIEGVYRRGEYDYQTYFSPDQKATINDACNKLYLELKEKINILPIWDDGRSVNQSGIK